MGRVATFCLMAQIILAPILLGGARPWAFGILSILTGVGLLAMLMAHTDAPYDSGRALPPSLPRYVLWVWGCIGIVIIWMVAQSLPIWPMMDAPFAANHIALYPQEWHGMAARLIWLGGVISLTALLARNGPDRLIRILTIALIAAVALQIMLAGINALAGWQTTFWFAKQAHIGDWTGSFANRNAFGGFVGLGVLACLYQFAAPGHLNWSKNLDQLGGWLAVGLIFLLALMQSHSRSSVIATTCAVLIFALIITPNGHRWKTVIAGGAAFGLLVGFAQLTAPDMVARFSDVLRPDLIQRDDAWATAIAAIIVRPLTGFGADSIALVMGHFATPGLNTTAHWFSSHNLWLDGAMILGLPVMILLVVAGLRAIISVHRTLFLGRDRALFWALVAFALLQASIGWIISLPALVLPLVVFWLGVFEASSARAGAGAKPADPAGQSHMPDQVSPSRL
ncbi:O-antigen ligase family protein [Thalassospira sp. MA62]|nr:O-antigen ligase family protein [Thalassospira sp. MA62]